MEVTDNGLHIYLYFVRHGETDWNLAKRVQGQTDISLNSTGVKQAQEASSRFQNLNFSSFYSSDLKRATETAKILQQQMNCSHATLNTHKALRERFFGDLEGLTYIGILFLSNFTYIVSF
jgi:broad specificity phosphatase PhoE